MKNENGMSKMIKFMSEKKLICFSNNQKNKSFLITHTDIYELYN